MQKNGSECIRNHYFKKSTNYRLIGENKLTFKCHVLFIFTYVDSNYSSYFSNILQ